MFKILETVASLTADTVVGVADLFDVLVSSGYGASYGKLSRNMRRIERQRTQENLAKQLQTRERQRYHSFIYKMKRDGLLIERKKKKMKFFALTATGKEKLDALRIRQQERMPKTLYTADAAKQFTIVTFDIPERERRKRDWLRGALRNLGLAMVQKSVWIGKVKIPGELVEDMKSMRILDFVEIFEISKTGSLQQVT